jgi:hypothetical protein
MTWEWTEERLVRAHNWCVCADGSLVFATSASTYPAGATTFVLGAADHDSL